MNFDLRTTRNEAADFSMPLPMILLASDYPPLAANLHRALQQDGLSVEFAPGYPDLEPLSGEHQDAIVLLEVSSQRSVEAAVELALRLKRRNSGRFVGYLADPFLHTSGLAGDAIFPRGAQHLLAALRSHFKQQSDSPSKVTEV